jgi:hypothetical protein
MIIDSQGHILTNFHVVGGAAKMEVTLADGSKYPTCMEGFMELVSSLKSKGKIPILALDHRTGNTGTVLVAVQ